MVALKGKGDGICGIMQAQIQLGRVVIGNFKLKWAEK